MGSRSVTGEVVGMEVIPYVDSAELAYPQEVRDQLSELQAAREDAVSELLYEYRRGPQMTAEGTLTRLNRRLYDLSQVDTELRLAAISAERQLEDEARAQRAVEAPAEQRVGFQMPGMRQLLAAAAVLFARL